MLLKGNKELQIDVRTNGHKSTGLFSPIRKWWNIIFGQQARTAFTTASSNQLRHRVGSVNAEMSEKLKKTMAIDKCKSVSFPEYPGINKGRWSTGPQIYQQGRTGQGWEGQGQPCCSDHKMVEFKILYGGNKAKSWTSDENHFSSRISLRKSHCRQSRGEGRPGTNFSKP